MKQYKPFVLKMISAALVLTMLFMPARAAKENEEKVRMVQDRAIQMVRNLEETADLSDLNMKVNMYADKFSPEYQELLDIMDEVCNEYGTFKIGSHGEKYCYINLETQPSKDNKNKYGIGKNDLLGLSAEYNSLYCDEDGLPNREKLDEIKQTIQTQYQLALSVIEEGMSDVEKALALYDYIIISSNYPDIQYWDDEGNEIYDDRFHAVANVFYEGISVCSANSEAYAYLLADAGIPAITVTSDTMNHAWTMLKIDGEWYHADPTWDNSRYESGWTSRGDYNADSWDLGAVGHQYFLKSDREIRELDHDDWKLDMDYSGLNLKKAPKASADHAFSESFFSDFNPWGNQTAFQYANGNWYACNSYCGDIVEVKYGEENQARFFNPTDEDIKFLFTDDDKLYLCTEKYVYSYETGSDCLTPVFNVNEYGSNAVITEMRIARGNMDLIIVNPLPSQSEWETFEKHIPIENL